MSGCHKVGKSSCENEIIPLLTLRWIKLFYKLQSQICIFVMIIHNWKNFTQLEDKVFDKMTGFWCENQAEKL